MISHQICGFPVSSAHCVREVGHDGLCDPQGDDVIVYDSLDPASRERLRIEEQAKVLMSIPFDESTLNLDAIRRDCPNVQRMREARELLALPTVEDACRAKWAAGRESHGNGPWIGDAPLVEAYPEYLDAINYIDEHLRSYPGDRSVIELRMETLSIAVRLRALLLRKK